MARLAAAAPYSGDSKDTHVAEVSDLEVSYLPVVRTYNLEMLEPSVDVTEEERVARASDGGPSGKSNMSFRPTNQKGSEHTPERVPQEAGR